MKRDPKLDRQIGGERLGQRGGNRSIEPKTGNLAGERLERLETMPNPSRGKKTHGQDGRKKQRNATNDENMSGYRRDIIPQREILILQGVKSTRIIQAMTKKKVIARMGSMVS